MPFTQDLDRLQMMANSSLSEVGWAGFQRYLDFRAKGLRRVAMEALHSFVLDVERWDFEKRKSFVSWVSNRATDFADQGLLISNELLTRVVGPTYGSGCRVSRGRRSPITFRESIVAVKTGTRCRSMRSADPSRLTLPFSRRGTRSLIG